MNFRTPIPVHPVIVFADLVHAGARADTQPLDRLARVQCAVDIHQQHIAIGDGEPVRTGNAGRIQQAVHHHRVRIVGRLLQVIGDEIRKLFRPTSTGIDGQPARRLPILAFLADSTEVACAQECRKVAVGVLACIEPETGKAQILRQLLAAQPAATVIECRRVVSQLLCLAIDDVVNVHRCMEIQSQVEELGLELAVAIGPQRVVLPVADGLILIPVQRLKRPRQQLLMALVRRVRQFARLPLQPGVVERLRLPESTQTDGLGR